MRAMLGKRYDFVRIVMPDFITRKMAKTQKIAQRTVFGRYKVICPKSKLLQTIQNACGRTKYQANFLDKQAINYIVIVRCACATFVKHIHTFLHGVSYNGFYLFHTQYTGEFSNIFKNSLKLSFNSHVSPTSPHHTNCNESFTELIS